MFTNNEEDPVRTKKIIIIRKSSATSWRMKCHNWLGGTNGIMCESILFKGHVKESNFFFWFIFLRVETMHFFATSFLQKLF